MKYLRKKLLKNNSNKKLLPTPGIVHCRQSALSEVSSPNFPIYTRTSERPDPGNEPYPKTLAQILNSELE